MIKHVSIRNFAILDEIEIDFNPSLTIITGETGSGKSILLQAIGVATGAKGSKTMIKSGENRSMVEVEFKENTFRRILFNSGAVKSFVNEEPVKISDLQNSTFRLIDFHGQHDQQLIMDDKTHIDYLDRFGNLIPLTQRLEELFIELKNAREELEKRIQYLASSKEKIELLEFQRNEISLVNPQLDEDISLDAEYRKLNNLDEIQNTVKVLQESLIQQDQSASEKLTLAIKDLQGLTRYAPEMAPIANQIEDALISIQDAVDSITQISEGVEFDPDQLRQYEDRIQALEGLKRKYGGSIESAIERLNTIEKELMELSNLDENIYSLKKRINDLEKEYSKLAFKVHDKRTKLVDPLAKAVEKEMETLNMPGGKFKINLAVKNDPDSFLNFEGAKVRLFTNGFDSVTFFLSANPGEMPKPLAEIASGGEVSRIMLAIKTVFSAIDPVQTLIFDEIDTGISGVTAEKVADSLVKLAKNKQVICITHLPQIAAKAEHHLHVKKSIMEDKTTVSLNYVNGQDRSNVIKQLYSGKDILESSYGN